MQKDHKVIDFQAYQERQQRRQTELPLRTCLILYAFFVLLLGASLFGWAYWVSTPKLEQAVIILQNDRPIKHTGSFLQKEGISVSQKPFWFLKIDTDALRQQILDNNLFYYRVQLKKRLGYRQKDSKLIIKISKEHPWAAINEDSLLMSSGRIIERSSGLQGIEPVTYTRIVCADSCAHWQTKGKQLKKVILVVKEYMPDQPLRILELADNRHLILRFDDLYMDVGTLNARLFEHKLPAIASHYQSAKQFEIQHDKVAGIDITGDNHKWKLLLEEP